MSDLQDIKDDLFETISNYKNIVWIELGVFRGVNGQYIFKNFDILKMYLIDPYVPLDYIKIYYGTKEIVLYNKSVAKENLKNYEKKCIWLEDFSENVHIQIPNESVDIIYIDGCHSFESVLSDLRLYYSKIKFGGLIIGDDYNEDGVKRAIELFSKENNLSYKISRANKIRQFSATDKFWFIK